MIAAQPTAPAPNTASIASGAGRRTLRMAPAPVWMPHPSGASVVSGASVGTLTRLRSSMSACLAERRLAEEVTVDGLTRAPHRRAAVRARATEEIARVEVAAVRGSSRQAIGARAARAERCEDVVADLDAGDRGAHLLHDAGAFVAQHAGKGEGEMAGLGGEVGVAQACRDQAHEHLVRARLIQVDVLEQEWGAGGVHDGGGRSDHLGPRLVGVGRFSRDRSRRRALRTFRGGRVRALDLDL